MTELIGVARYHTDPATNYVDVAFVIRDDWQRQGLGGQLLNHLIEIARANGIEGFSADVLGDNIAMLRVFHKSGLQMQSQLSAGVYDLRMPLGTGSG